MANNVVLKTNTGLLPPKEGAGRARQLAQHAVQMSPYLADPHAQLAYVYRTYDCNWAASEAELQRTLSLAPYQLTCPGERRPALCNAGALGRRGATLPAGAGS